MSEENHETPVLENAIDMGTATDTPQVAPEGEKVEPVVEESLEVKYDRVTRNDAETGFLLF